jgi:YD repeat-containing protein
MRSPLSRTHRRFAAAAALAAAAAASATPALGIVRPNVPGQQANRSADFFDARADAGRAPAARRPSAATRSARAKLRGTLGRQGVLAIDPLTGTSRVLARLDGALTGPAAGAPRAVAWQYARANAAVLGLTAADFASFREPRARTSRSGITTVRWRQVFRGIPAYDNGLRVALGRGNRVLSVQGSPVHGLRVPSVVPALTAEQALRALMDAVGSRGRVAVTARSSGARRATRFAGGDRARLVLFHGRSTRLAWSVTHRASSRAWYDAVVDATTGAVLRRTNLVRHAAPVTVFENYPGAPSGGEQEPRDLEALGYLTPGATTLSGPFARTYLDVDDSNTPDPGEDVAAAEYEFEDFTPAVGADGFCEADHQCSWDPAVRSSWEDNAPAAAVQAHYYVSRFHDHLHDSPAGFTDADGNFEGADRVEVNADDGADTGGDGGPDEFYVNNAFMATPPDGEPPLMGMFLFEPFEDFGLPFRAMNGSDDATIVYHEYTHGLSNRLVVNDDGAGALNSFQSGSMGEAWSDWYAKDFLARQGHVSDDPAVDGEVYLGEYSDGERGLIRTEAIDCSVGAPASVCPGGIDGNFDGVPESGPGGYTFGDLSTVSFGPEVHADGEIWGQTLWDLRQRLVVQRGSEIAGSDVALQLITDAMRISPPEPSFLDMRNAILQADVGANGGANRALLWSVFAQRGMGYFAGTLDANDFEGVEDFAIPPGPGSPTGTITGKLTDATTGMPVRGQTIGVGGHATDPSFVDALVTTSGADGRFALTVPAGTYRNVTIKGGGYTPIQEDDVAVPPGGRATIDATVTRNWASPDSGARLTTNDDTFAAFGCGVDQLVDQSSGTGWSAYKHDFDPGDDDPFIPPNPHFGEPAAVTIKFARPIDIDTFLMDPGPTCGDNVFSMTARYRVDTSIDGETFRLAKHGSFHPSDANRLHRIPPDANAADVQYVRLSLLDSFRDIDFGQLFIDFSEFVVVGGPRNARPGGTLTAAPGAVAPNQAVALTASFTDPDSRITGYDWDLDGNGTVDQTTDGPTTSTSYGAEGAYAPKVFAKDFRGGAGIAETTVQVSQPRPGGRERPRIQVSRIGRNGRVRLRVTCDSACAGRADVRARRGLARRLDLGRRRGLGRKAIVMTRPGTKRITIRLNKRTRRAMRRAGARRIKPRLVAVVTDAERQTRRARVTVRVRR